MFEKLKTKNTLINMGHVLFEKILFVLGGVNYFYERCLSQVSSHGMITRAAKWLI